MGAGGTPRTGGFKIKPLVMMGASALPGTNLETIQHLGKHHQENLQGQIPSLGMVLEIPPWIFSVTATVPVPATLPETTPTPGIRAPAEPKAQGKPLRTVSQ